MTRNYFRPGGLHKTLQGKLNQPTIIHQRIWRSNKKITSFVLVIGRGWETVYAITYIWHQRVKWYYGRCNNDQSHYVKIRNIFRNSCMMMFSRQNTNKWSRILATRKKISPKLAHLSVEFILERAFAEATQACSKMNDILEYTNFIVAVASKLELCSFHVFWTRLDHFFDNI